MSRLVTIETVLSEVEISHGELSAWIEQKWVLPTEEEGRLLFNEADRARIALIIELRRDLAINDEAMPVVLQLLDQVYAMRRAMNELHAAIAELPEDIRCQLETHLHKDDQG